MNLLTLGTVEQVRVAWNLLNLLTSVCKGVSKFGAFSLDSYLREIG